MKKYQPFAEYLASHPGPEVCMSFALIERILHARLPPSAFRYRAWWANHPRNRAFAQAWLGAGWKTTAVDLKTRQVRFVKQSTLAPQTHRKVRFEDIYGALQGWLKVEPGVDLAAPAWPGLGDYIERKYGPLPRKRGARS